MVTPSPAGLADQLVRMLRATEPLLLCVDDLDLVGADGRETVDVLGDRVRELPVVLLVGTHRHRPRRGAWAPVPLPPLSADDAGLLLAEAGVPLPRGLRERILAEGFHNEGPTFSPNGRVVMFFREPGGSGGPSLYTIDISGRNELRVPTPGFASDPAWSPLLS